jgi:aminodeoxyfutalosine deaminase
MIVHRAAWILPIISSPIRNGWVAVDRGRIVAIGGPAEAPPDADSARGAVRAPAGAAGGEPPFDQEAILPGLVNAHTHLELSWMQGQVPPDSSMPAWAARLIARRKRVEQEPSEPIRRAVTDLRASGTALVGDISNTMASWRPLVESRLSGCVFRELLGFAAAAPDELVARARAELDAVEHAGRMRRSIVPHAPYSVAPGLFEAIARAARDEDVVSVHLAESPEEVEFLQSGRGAWREQLDRLGAWDARWTPPRCGPVGYLDRFGLVHSRLMAVHGVQLTDAELARLAEAGATVVACPRSNGWTGAGDPPIARFYASGVRVAVGTDSLASGDDLNLFSELAAMRALAPEVPAAEILQSATLSGAEALGFAGDFGAIEPGMRAELIAVRVPFRVGDVEEYLLSGIAPAAIRWIS